MIRLRFGVDDLGQVRFAFSPVWEAVTSIRSLAGSSGLHAPWRAGVRTDATDLELLTTVIRPTGYLPDFLHPLPQRQAPGFDAGLAMVAATDPDLVATELAHLAHHPRAMQGPDRDRRYATLIGFVRQPEDGLARIIAALDRHWRASIAPHWPRMRALLSADLDYRLRELGAGGVRRLLRTLHPSVTFDHDTLSIVKYYEGTADLGGRGLLLVPCVFAWPDVLVRTADPQPAVTYSPRGLGRLWETQARPDGTPLADLLGASRAAILGQLDVPMSTTHLAAQLDLAAPTVNVHLKILERAGVVTSRRDGRTVLYQRTQLGELLQVGRDNWAAADDGG